MYAAPRGAASTSPAGLWGARGLARMAALGGAAMLAYGDKMPDLDLVGLDGKKFPLESYRKKRHVALVFFRGSW